MNDVGIKHPTLHSCFQFSDFPLITPKNYVYQPDMKLKFEDTARRSTKKYHTFSKSAGDILNPASCSGAGRELFTLSRSSSSERKSFKRKKKIP